MNQDFSDVALPALVDIVDTSKLSSVALFKFHGAGVDEASRSCRASAVKCRIMALWGAKVVFTFISPQLTGDPGRKDGGGGAVVGISTKCAGKTPMDEITGEMHSDLETRLGLRPAASLLFFSADEYPTLRLHSAMHARCPVSPAEGVSCPLGGGLLQEPRLYF